MEFNIEVWKISNSETSVISCPLIFILAFQCKVGSGKCYVYSEFLNSLNWLDFILLRIKACSHLDWKEAESTVCVLRRVSACPLCACVGLVWEMVALQGCQETWTQGEPPWSRVCCDVLEVQDVGDAGDARWQQSYDWGIRTFSKTETFEIPKVSVICSIYEAGEKLNKEWFYEL